ncbi:MAG: class I SAM-dependent methyltransferase [bacterium]|nr:SAM-dependent methyltransferase [Deltaproteobacteria bacterium]MCP4904156.1 class I SAM-dependent methyltransferase [bacterium]
MDKYDSLERIVPDRVDDADQAGSESLLLHQERYRFAAEHARSGRLLDLACGVGYGTRLLADARDDIEGFLGVDVARTAVEYAQRVYSDERVRYVQADAMSFGEDGASSFDTIVSLETIEHLPEPEVFFERLCRLLKPGGVLIASVPTTPSVDLNPHHLHDFTLRSFRRLGERAGLAELASHQQIQRVGLAELWSRDRRFRREQLRPNLVGYYASHPGAFVRRIATTLRHGLANHYRTIVWRAEG